MTPPKTTERLKRLGVLAAEPRFFYRPHVRQRQFHAAGQMARERLFLAGNRVGKTLAGAAEVAFHLTGLYPAWWRGARFDRPVQAWAASVTREATRDILQPVYLGAPGRPRGMIPARLVLERMHKGGIANAVDYIKVRHAGGGVSVLGFKSYDQGRESFQGTARDVIHLDEEPPIDVYEECLLRTLTTQGHVLLTMTPLLGVTDVVRHFTAGRGGGKAVIKAGWQDAPHLREDEMNRLRGSLRPHEIAARELGVPQLGRGRVFPIEEKEIRCERFEIPKSFRRCVGVDFGWSNPTAAVWLAHDAAADTVYVTDVYWRAEATPGDHAGEILRRGKWIPVVGDPAGQAAGISDGRSLFALYEQAGLRLQAAGNDVEAGLMALLERMRAERFKVFADCAAWWEEFRHYARDARGKIVKRDDHLMDATRYALMSGLAIARADLPPPPPRAVRDWRVV